MERTEGVLEWTLKTEQRARAEELDGAYFLRTSRKDMNPEEIWRTYISLTRIESALLPTADGRTLAIRRASVPDRRVGEIYRHLNVNPEPMAPIRTWL